MSPDFDKYHKITSAGKVSLPPAPCLVQEKMDGANFGIQLKRTEGLTSLLVHSRNLVLAEVFSGGAVERKQEKMGAFDLAVQQIATHATEIISIMHEESLDHVYGEWMTPHTVKYPDEIKHTIFLYDAVDSGGIFRDVIGSALFKIKTKVNNNNSEQALFTYPATLFLDAPDEHEIKVFLALLGRPTEGAVIKYYDLDASGELNQFGERHCYKYVLPEFKEALSKNPMFPAPTAALSIEDKLINELPDRSIEKVYQKICDLKGTWDNRYFPMFLGMMWQEFLEEHAVTAFQKYKMPTVDLSRLKRTLDQRSRNWVLTASSTLSVGN